MAKISKTEISAKILKRKKIKVFIIRITPKAFQLTARVRSFIQTKHETNWWSGSSSSVRHRILAALFDFVEETEKRKKKFTRQIPQGQYAYCKYLEIIRVGVFEWEQKQVAAAAGRHSKNNKSPPPHSGWGLKNYQVNSPGAIWILQIFGNNPSRGFKVRAKTKCGGGQTQQKQSLHHHSGWRLNKIKQPRKRSKP